jgi:hypothetical protein
MSRHNYRHIEVEVEVTTYGPSWYRVPIWNSLPNFFFCIENCGASSLKRGWVCNLFIQLLLGLARTVTLWHKSRTIHGHIFLSHSRLPQPGGPRPCIYIPQEHVGPAIQPGTGLPSYDSQGYRGGILTRFHTTISTKVGINFADKRRSLGRYSSLPDLGHEVPLLYECRVWFSCCRELVSQSISREIL